MGYRLTSDILIVLNKSSGHHYIFRFSVSTRADMVRVFKQFAENPRLDFSWYDAARLSQRVCDVATTD